MDDRLRLTADDARRQIASGHQDPRAFREALRAVPAGARDAWVDRVLGLDAVPDDGPELPRGCVPYLPCGVEVLRALVDSAGIGPADVLVDIGAGVGRATALVHLLTGAGGVGVEVQAPLVEVARSVARWVSPRLVYLHGDAAALTAELAVGSVFFLYCPFGGARLAGVLAALEAIARTRPIRVGCVDLPLPACAWLAVAAERPGGLTVYRSTSPGGG